MSFIGGLRYTESFILFARDWFKEIINAITLAAPRRLAVLARRSLFQGCSALDVPIPLLVFTDDSIGHIVRKIFHLRKSFKEKSGQNSGQPLASRRLVSYAITIDGESLVRCEY